MIEPRAFKAGLLYCAVVFAAGFVLGGLRTLYVAPLSGELIAVALEAPVMLAISWSACGWIAERLEVPDEILPRLIMGGVALVCMAAAEAGLALIMAGGRPFSDYLLQRSPAALVLGVLAQFAFAVFPVLRRPRNGTA
jgi:hypothetical protein